MTTSKQIYIYSRHPLALKTVRHILTEHCASFSAVCFTSTPALLAFGGRPCLLIIDACSVEHWPEITLRWHAQGGRTLLLVSADQESTDDQLGKLRLGVWGLVSIDSSLEDQLPSAVKAVCSARLWFNHRTLDEYACKLHLQRLYRSDQRLTAREEQVLELIKHGSSNKEISAALGISERTAKFHVSNVLRKSNTGRRQYLRVS